MNCLPCPKGVSSTLSLLTIVANTTKLDCNLLSLEFGEYIEIYEDNEYATNSPNSQETSAITLHPIFNTTESYHFILLVTSKTLIHGN